MYKIRDPSEDLLKYPDYARSKTSVPGDKNAFSNLESALEHFNDLGQDITKQYHWAGMDIIRHLYHNYLFNKYGVKCRLNTKKIKDLNIKQNEGHSKIIRHAVFFEYGVNLKLYTFKNATKEAKSEMHYKEYLEVLSESIVDCLLKNKNKILPFMVSLSGLQHANLIIFRTNNFTVEAFEPHGQIMGGQPDKTVQKIKNRYNELVQYINAELSKRNQTNYTLYNVDETCPELHGIQIMEGRSTIKHEISEGGGYCALWSLFIAEMALINKNLTLREIVNSVLKHKSSEDINTFLHKVARGMTVYISEKIKKYYETVFDYNMTIKEIVVKHSAKLKREKYEKMYKLFKIYLLLEYELFETGKTPSELLEYYEKQQAPEPGESDKIKKDLDLEFSYKTEYKIYQAKLEILKNMIKNNVKKTPIINMNRQSATSKTSKRAENVENKLSQKHNGESYLLSKNKKKCRKGYTRSKKNSKLCIKNTMKQTFFSNSPPSIITSSKDPRAAANNSNSNNSPIVIRDRKSRKNNRKRIINSNSNNSPIVIRDSKSRKNNRKRIINSNSNNSPIVNSKLNNYSNSENDIPLNILVPR